MTDKYFALTVLLDCETREDDAQAIIEAIKMIKGVMEVEPHIANIALGWATHKARLELRTKIIDLLWPKDLIGESDYIELKA